MLQGNIFVLLVNRYRLCHQLRSESRAAFEGARIRSSADCDRFAVLSRPFIIHFLQSLNQKTVFVVVQRRLMMNLFIRHADSVEGFQQRSKGKRGRVTNIGNHL